MKLAFILGDQLSTNVSSLKNIDKQDDLVFMCEVNDEATYVQHHKKKLVYIFSCMRHFAQKLKNDGYKVIYKTLDDANNFGSFKKELTHLHKTYNFKEIFITEPGEYRVYNDFKSLTRLPITFCEDDKFFCSTKEFETLEKLNKTHVMEKFYRKMRVKHKILMDKNNPIGGQWNFDKENRKPPSKNIKFKERLFRELDAMTKEVITLTEQFFPNNFGEIMPFPYAVTNKEAEQELAYFIKEFLPNFGTYQDAMLEDEAFLNHSILSMYFNNGLLCPKKACKLAEQEYYNGNAPLASVEGFIRQILGWREYIRGIYWLYMPEYASKNFFKTDKPLPDFFWTAKTKMNCIKNVVEQTKKYAYSHHIQRLMITGNFALIAGLNSEEVCAWYLTVYLDAYEWVELPNTLGMALFGDGGLLATKPYAASGKYINKMSNFCGSCKYNVQTTEDEDSCPFNSLYWHFLIRNKELLKNNHRLFYMFSTFYKFTSQKQHEILKRAENLLLNLGKI